jgi:hypothetical protein
VWEIFENTFGGYLVTKMLSFLRSASNGSSECDVGGGSKTGTVLFLIITSRCLFLQMAERKLVIISWFQEVGTLKLVTWY